MPGTKSHENDSFAQPLFSCLFLPVRHDIHLCEHLQFHGTEIRPSIQSDKPKSGEVVVNGTFVKRQRVV